MARRKDGGEAQVAAPEPLDFPGRRLGVTALLLSMLVGVVGSAAGAVALTRASRAGHGNAPAVAAILIGVLHSTVFALVLWFVLQTFAGNVGPCADLGPGAHEGGGVTFECPE
jgi:hypothetical protein